MINNTVIDEIKRQLGLIGIEYKEIKLHAIIFGNTYYKLRLDVSNVDLSLFNMRFFIDTIMIEQGKLTLIIWERKK